MTISVTSDPHARLRQRLAAVSDADLGYAPPASSGTLATTIHVHEIPDLVKWSIVEPSLHQHALCFLGSSAIGKTYAVRQGFLAACEELDRRPVLHELHVSQMGPTDVLGVPRDDGKGRTVWHPPRMFPLESAAPDHARQYREATEDLAAHNEWYIYWDAMREYPQYGLFFDEVTNPSNPSIIHQCFSIWHGKFVADHRLLPDTAIILAGNRVQDRTNSIPLAASATSRLDMIEVVPSLAGWLQSWAMDVVRHEAEDYDGHNDRTRVHPLVIAFLHRNSHLFAPDASGTPQMEPFPAPRNWSYVSDLLYAAETRPLPDRLLFAAVAGRVGDKAARDLWAFRQHAAELPDVDLLLNTDGDPYGWLPEEWPRRLDLLHILAVQMVHALNETNSRRFMTFMLDEDKLPPEVAAAASRMLRPAGKLDPLADAWQPDLFERFGDKYHEFLHG